MNDAALYGAVAEELERGLVRTDLWAKALAESDGNEPAAHERYVVVCAEQLQQELADGAAPRERTGAIPTDEPAIEIVEDEGPAADTVTLQEPATEVDGEMQARAASAVPQWTPHKPRGLARSTMLPLILGALALLGALGLTIAAFEGQGVALGIAGLVLVAVGFYRLGKAGQDDGPIL